MTFFVFLWCIVLVSANDLSCRLISKKPHGELNVYIVKKKLYLSTFEIKDTVSWKVHLQPPSNLYPHTLIFKPPNVAVDCNGEFANCTALKMHNDIRLKPTSRQWLHVRSLSSTPIRINIFRKEKLHQDLSFLTGPILTATLSLTISHLIYKI
ncbi:hypothetical protein B9Z55_022171 [Caenorhabditis nigoni]|uniref:Uncharacterized protein n=1 Tax=Caenorhabditis nigoni TaxID=1611254 RepID=A0A2G5SJ19_9PELO|nr:hypothetical protein B9Z55_022171 [Caenorhabditis nigoni]